MHQLMCPRLCQDNLPNLGLDSCNPLQQFRTWCVEMSLSCPEQAEHVLVHAMRPATDGHMQASDMWSMQALLFMPAAVEFRLCQDPHSNWHWTIGTIQQPYAQVLE